MALAEASDVTAPDDFAEVEASDELDRLLDPLTDQQLAGVVMWVPGGLVHLGAALALLAAWLHEGDGRHPSREPPLAA